MRSVHYKHDEPGLKDGQVCIGYIQGTSLAPLGWRTKVASETRVRDWLVPGTEPCTAIIVDRAEMIERGHEDCGG